MYVLDIRLADAVASLVVGVVRLSTLSILDFNSSTVFVTDVTISIGAPFFPIKNNDGNGTNLSANKMKTENLKTFLMEWRLARKQQKFLETLHI